MTYREAENKIIEAYFKDEIQPLDACYCFCGTLCDSTMNWCGEVRERHNDSHGYLGDDFVRMEKALLETMSDILCGISGKSKHPRYEDAIFAGMSAALDVLKQIHAEKGEDVEQTIPFTKRQLLKTN